jgi:hypothetical protein
MTIQARVTLAMLMVFLMAMLSACDSGPSLEEQRAATLAARMEAEAAERLQNLHEMRAIGRDDLALSFADDILKRFANTRAAVDAAPLAAELRQKVEAQREAERLRELWAYHDAEDAEAGGRVRTAYIYSSNAIGPAVGENTAPTARLVLRRHPQWGDDVYLLSERGHFRCGTPCTVQVQFDDAAAVTFPGSIPSTGEPAIFVEDFKQFVSALPAASRVRITIELQDGGVQTPEFEVGGYNPSTVGSP